MNRAIALVLTAFLSGCAGRLPSEPGKFEARHDVVQFRGRELPVTLIKPVTPKTPASLVMFATGDAGWFGASGKVYERLAQRGYDVAGFDSREVLAPVKSSGHLVKIADAADGVASFIEQAKKALGLPEATPVIVVGFSRGANLVVFTAGAKSLQHQVRGALAIALTRETDFLEVPDAAVRSPSVQVDDKGRIQTYPAIALAGPIPFAVIQSKGDSYVPAEEARRLFGPDTATRRLYEVDARNHGFSGGTDELMRDVDDALAWIEKTAP